MPARGWLKLPNSTAISGEPVAPPVPPAGLLRAAAHVPVLNLALVNLMPAAAMGKTERQFQKLLHHAPLGVTINLRLFTLQHHLPAGGRYEPLEALWESRIDGLIVTGTEPKAALMTDEPCWPDLARLVDWAGEHTAAAIWSCFAAHAAVLRLDGITRRPLPQKLSGVFTCCQAAPHELLAGMPAAWAVPHSRRNQLDEAELRAAGYVVLSSGGQVGVDGFTKLHGNSRFVFFQGHPEYGGSDLLGEYYRDIRRFIAGERADYPPMPEGCLDEKNATAFALLQARLMANPAAEIFETFSRSAPRATAHEWRDATRIFYANWLGELAARRLVSASVTA